MSHENVALFREAIDAFNRRDRAPWLGITTRTFRDPGNSNRVGVIFNGVPDLETFEQGLQSDEAAEAMKHDGVRPETIVTLVEA